MNSSLHDITKDMQARIRELAYLMWESAGRQHGMAIEYWLKAETEVVSTLQAAASRIVPGSTPSEPQGAEETPAEVAPPPAAPEPELKAPELEAPAPAPVEAQPQKAAKAPAAPAAATKPAPRRTTSRAKKA